MDDAKASEIADKIFSLWERLDRVIARERVWLS